MAGPDRIVKEEGGGRPWAMGGGIVLLGLMTSIISNAWGVQHEGDPSLRPWTNTFYAVGLVISGWGVHRLLWFRPSPRPAWMRLAITAVVTVPVFALAGLILSFLFLMMFYRFG